MKPTWTDIKSLFTKMCNKKGEREYWVKDKEGNLYLASGKKTNKYIYV